MQTFAGLMILVVIIILVLRQWLLHRTGPAPDGEAFAGAIYLAGKAAIAERDCQQPRSTAICMHGFCENAGYFMESYSAQDVQLIVLTSCDYHLPVLNPRYVSADWLSTPDAAEGSIAYDAAVLLQALEHLPRTGHVRVHGHSRGGAVVLEAAGLRPDLFSGVEVILEAAVLPQAHQRRKISGFMLWLLPLLLPLWRRYPINSGNRQLWGSLENARKRHLIRQLPFNPKRASTMIANLRSFQDWVGSRNYDLYGALHQGTIMVAGDDRILDPLSMQQSAKQASGMDLLVIDNCSHFILLDNPETVPDMQRWKHRKPESCR